MPIYVYERPDGSRFEVRQGFNDPHLTEDPQTGGPVRRVLQPAPIIFKGSGWYKTDSRATNTANAEAKAPAEGNAPEAAPSAEKGAGAAETPTGKAAVREATDKTTSEIKKASAKPASPAAAS